MEKNIKHIFKTLATFVAVEFFGIFLASIIVGLSSIIFSSYDLHTMLPSILFGGMLLGLFLFAFGDYTSKS